MPQRQPRQSPLLLAAGFRHAFYGRSGGVSCGNFASLNCSYSVGDDPAHVTENLTRIAADLDVPIARLATVSQVHGCRVVNADDLQATDQLRNEEADAVIAGLPDRAVAVRTADCVPLLVGCRLTGLVAAIHAGWRGVVARVVPATIGRLLDAGARPESLLVAIGPHIREQAFEVSPEIAAELDAAAPGAGSVRWDLGPRPHVSLSTILCTQLLGLGIPAAHIEDLEACTYSDSKGFFSYRRDGQRSGRQLSVIRSLPRTLGDQPNN